MKIDEAVILLGGMGTRLLPLTKTVPKEMLPVYDVPNIFLLVEEAYLSGIKRIIFVVTEHNKDLIQSFFQKDEYLDNFLKDKPDKQPLLARINKVIQKMDFQYVFQDLKGTYGALYSAKDFIKNDNFIVMYGDDLIETEIPLTKSLIMEWEKDHKMQVAIKDSKPLPKVGLVELGKDDCLKNLVSIDKPNSGYILHGRMLINKKIFTVKEALPKHKNDEYYLPYALLHFSDDVHCFKYHGKYFNIGEKTGYIKASIYYAIKDSNNKYDLLTFFKEII